MECRGDGGEGEEEEAAAAGEDAGEGGDVRTACMG